MTTSGHFRVICIPSWFLWINGLRYLSVIWCKPLNGIYHIFCFLASSRLYTILYEKQVVNKALLILTVDWLLNVATQNWKWIQSQNFSLKEFTEMICRPIHQMAYLYNKVGLFWSLTVISEQFQENIINNGWMSETGRCSRKWCRLKRIQISKEFW